MRQITTIVGIILIIVGIISFGYQGFTYTKNEKIAEIGNADNSDYEETIIQAKKNVDKVFLDKLKTALKESFVVADVEKLDEDAETDLVIIIGSKKNE